MRKLISYFFPIKIKVYPSKISGNLEINMVNGRKILDTQNSNYSFGSLQAILKTGLKKIGFDSTFTRVLVLGMGGGSILHTIRTDFSSLAFVELVELDAEIISIAESEFNINRFSNIKIVHADALEYIQTCTGTFDLIIVDVFVLDTVPIGFTQPGFIEKMCHCLTSKGKIIFNTMRNTMPEDVRESIRSVLSAQNLFVKVLEGVGGTNDLILAEKR
ncbi:MAG TPA: methyltransferase domain-containing protein [Bacteroidia bacterium]|nr:methyltransferase domain-containing protein [Bacteroidia bacterium]